MPSVRRYLYLATVTLAVACAVERQSDTPRDSAGAARASANTTAGTSTTAVVTPRGIGPLRAGATIAEASAALGGALTIPTGADTTGCTYLEWRGGPQGVRVMFEAGRVARVDVTEAGIRSSAGAGVGDAESEVQRLYAGRAVVTPHKYVEGHYLTISDPADSSFALVFETTGGKVTRYRAGRRPQVEYVEGCG